MENSFVQKCFNSVGWYFSKVDCPENIMNKDLVFLAFTPLLNNCKKKAIFFKFEKILKKEYLPTHFLLPIRIPFGIAHPLQAASNAPEGDFVVYTICKVKPCNPNKTKTLFSSWVAKNIF